MIFNLCAGEVLKIGDVVTMTILAVEGDLICLGLETAGGVSSTIEDVSKIDNGANCKQKGNWWELN
jgi:sRNA-binding carbon storage regulator CsrA